MGRVDTNRGRRIPAAFRDGACEQYAWVFTLVIFICAAFIYVLDSTPQRFEQYLPVIHELQALIPAGFQDPPAWVRHHLADFAWSLLAAKVAGRYWPVENHLLRLCLLLLAATSWEWAQFAGMVSGYFDVIDLAAGAAAAVLVWAFSWQGTHTEGAAT